MAVYTGADNWTAQQDSTGPSHDAVASLVGVSSLRDVAMRPAAAVAETVSRSMVNGTAYSPPSGTLALFGIAIPEETPVGHIAFLNGVTAAGTPTHWWFGLFDKNRNLLARTDDQLTAAWAANSTQNLAITTLASGAGASYRTTYSGLHYLGIMVAATTVPNLMTANVTSNANFLALPPILAGTANTGMSTPPAFPFQANALTAITSLVFGYAGT